MASTTTATSDERVSNLLAQMLVPILRVEETPLQFEIDGCGIAAAALENQRDLLDNSHKDGGRMLLTELDELVWRMCLGEQDDDTAVAISFDRDTAAPGATTTRIGRWLEELFERFRVIDPLALKILGLRLEGMACRDIAAQFGTGLRLIRRIIEEMKTVCCDSRRPTHRSEREPLTSC